MKWNNWKTEKGFVKQSAVSKILQNQVSSRVPLITGKDNNNTTLPRDRCDAPEFVERRVSAMTCQPETRLLAAAKTLYL